LCQTVPIAPNCAIFNRGSRYPPDEPEGASAVGLLLLLGTWTASWAVLLSLSSWLSDVISRFTLARGDGGSVVRPNGGQSSRASSCDAVIAEFIRTRGITRCPTACVLPTQGSVDAADRAALEQHAMTQEKLRLARAASRARLFWNAPLSTQRDK
jgi:hypothetical protein